MAKYKKPLKENIAIETKEEIIATIVNCSSLNIRKEPNTSADILAVLPVGSLLVIGEDITKNKGFVKIKTSSGIEGWVMSKYIAIS